WAQVLRVGRVGVRDNFFALGGDSILSIQVIARARREGVRLTPKQLFEHQTVAALAAVADSRPVVRAEQGCVTGPVSLTPVQLWFLEQELPEPHHFNQATLLRPRERLEPGPLAHAVRALQGHHDALRLRFTRDAGGWRQHNAGPDQRIPFEHLDLSTLPDEARDPALAEHAAKCQAGLDLAEGPLLRVVLYELGPGRGQRLLVVVHHLAVDGVSWRILIEDLEAAYRRLASGEEVRLPAKTTSFRAWAGRLAEHARFGALDGEVAYWTADPPAPPAPLPVDHPGGARTEASARVVAAALGVDETEALLREVPQAYRATLDAVLLTALVQVLLGWTRGRSLSVNLEGHGREELFEGADLSRTVGWFTSIYPVHLDADPEADPRDVLRAVREQLGRIPRRGVGYGLLRYLHPDPAVRAALRARATPEVSFNYLGQFDGSFSGGALFSLAGEPRGRSQSARGDRAHVLDVTGMVSGGRLRMTWTYSESLHRAETIEQLAAGYIEALRGLIARCGSPGEHAYAPSDFAEATLTDQDLDDILAELSE
ncbi:MAG: non-ribosomal peptide synthetase, partial [Gemmatimonadetes bacterium]|nr:non-ribosomal peptide synthetase [Gemmatimonadota bacterium]